MAESIYARRYRLAHPERERAYRRRWQLANPEYHSTHARTWLAEHPTRAQENARKQSARRRARITRVLATLTAAEWEAILEAADYACIYCGSTKQITQDHLTPISRGGNHTAENVAPACGPCNSSKGAKIVTEFLAEATPSQP